MLCPSTVPAQSPPLEPYSSFSSPMEPFPATSTETVFSTLTGQLVTTSLRHSCRVSQGNCCRAEATPLASA